MLPKIAVPEGPLDLRALFPSCSAFGFEVGFGGGEHVVAQALAHPDTGFIACEPFVNGVAKLLMAIEAEDAFEYPRSYGRRARCVGPRAGPLAV